MRALRSKQHRPVFTPEERAQWVSRFRSSGLTQVQFAQQHGLKLTTLQRVLAAAPLLAHLSLLANRRRKRPKVLLFAGSGLWVCAIRLAKGTFGWPQGEGPSRCLRPEALSLLLHGLEAPRRRNWFRR